MAAQLSILSKDVRIQNGMYSLNDLHKAAGAENKHRTKTYDKNKEKRCRGRQCDQKGSIFSQGLGIS